MKLNKILKQFQSTQKMLQNFIEVNEVKLSKLQKEVEITNSEVSQATKVHSNISKLLGEGS